MFDLNKYIGIPFQEHGRTMEGMDCFGLVKYVLEKELGKVLPDFHAYDDTGDRYTIDALLTLNSPLLGKKVETPKLGDVALFRFYGVVTHIGLYVGNGTVLHILRGSDSVLEKINGRRLKGRIEGFYEISE